MFAPDLRPRLEERHFFARLGIRSRLLGPLPQRARDARQGEIICHGWPAGRPRDDMIDMERGFLAKLRELAVFTPIARAKNDLSTQRSRNIAHEARRSARKRNRVRKSARLTSPSASSRSWVV